MVTLSPEWEHRAFEWTTRVHSDCIHNNRVQADGRLISVEQRWHNNLMSYRAEMGVAKTMQLPWRACRDRKSPDVGGCIEVRARTVPGNGGDLPLRPDDDEKIERPFVLVHVHNVDQSIDVIGWLFGYEARERGGPERFGIVYVPPPYRSIDELIEWYQKLYLAGLIFRLPVPA